MWPHSHSLALTLSHSHTHAPTLTITLSHSHSLSHSQLSLSLSLTLSHTHSHSHTPPHSHSRTLSLTHSHTLTLLHSEQTWVNQVEWIPTSSTNSLSRTLRFAIKHRIRSSCGEMRHTSRGAQWPQSCRCWVRPGPGPGPLQGRRERVRGRVRSRGDAPRHPKRSTWRFLQGLSVQTQTHQQNTTVVYAKKLAVYKGLIKELLWFSNSTTNFTYVSQNLAKDVTLDQKELKFLFQVDFT